jgi:hypothetical protein
MHAARPPRCLFEKRVYECSVTERNQHHVHRLETPSYSTTVNVAHIVQVRSNQGGAEVTLVDRREPECQRIV